LRISKNTSFKNFFIWFIFSFLAIYKFEATYLNHVLEIWLFFLDFSQNLAIDFILFLKSTWISTFNFLYSFWLLYSQPKEKAGT